MRCPSAKETAAVWNIPFSEQRCIIDCVVFLCDRNDLTLSIQCMSFERLMWLTSPCSLFVETRIHRKQLYFPVWNNFEKLTFKSITNFSSPLPEKQQFFTSYRFYTTAIYFPGLQGFIGSELL